MPEPIRRVAHRHLREPHEVKIKSSTATVATIAQRYWQVGGLHKLDALTRILEVEDVDATLIFVRTRPPPLNWPSGWKRAAMPAPPCTAT